jgi:hypothetical protein
MDERRAYRSEDGDAGKPGIPSRILKRFKQHEAQGHKNVHIEDHADHTHETWEDPQGRFHGQRQDL